MPDEAFGATALDVLDGGPDDRCIEIDAAADPDIDERLWKLRHAGGKLAEALAGAPQHGVGDGTD